MSGTTFNAGDVVDKTLIAKVRVAVYSEVPGYIPAGKKLEDFLIAYIDPQKTVGRVNTYFSADPTKGRNSLWWEFYPASNYGKPYYTEHKPGIFDMTALKDQAVLSLQEKEEKKIEDNKEWYEKATDTAIKGLLTVAGVFVIGSLLVNLFKGNNK